jgi:hypothetical protein
MAQAKRKAYKPRKKAIPAPELSQHELNKKTFEHFLWNPLDYIQIMIVDPHNEATGKNIVISDQQKDAIEAVRQITTAQLKRAADMPMTPEEVETAKKIGVSIMSGKGCGKDAVAAWLIIWFLDCYKLAKTPCTSVSAGQLEKVLWSEIALWMTYADAKDRFTIQNDKFFRTDLESMGRNADERKQLKESVGKVWMAWPKTINPNATELEPEAIAGWHADNMMIVGDEVSGMKDAVCETLEGTLTSNYGPNFFLILFNPTRRKGYAIDTQYTNKEFWITLRWDAEKSPVASKDNIERIEKKYGRDSNTFRIRVKGLPPREDKGNLIPWDWIEDAMDREIEPMEHDPIVMAADCGAGVDPSIIGIRKGNHVYPFDSLTTSDSNKLEGWIGNKIDGLRPDLIWIDTIGIGWAVQGHLAKQKGSEKVKAADIKRRAMEPERFRNRRAEMFNSLRDLFQSGTISIPRDDELADELGALKWKDPDHPPLQIVEKKELRKELGRSTNKADTLGMLYFDKDEYISRTTKPHEDDYEDNAYRNDPSAWMGH